MGGRGVTVTEPAEWRQDRWRAAVLYGMSLTDIGAAEGLTRERVRQVVGSAWQVERKREALVTQNAAIVQLRVDHPDLTIKDIAGQVGRVGTDVSAVLRAAGLELRAHRTPRHGTLTEYTLHRCRCEACVATKRASEARKFQRLRLTSPEHIPHGLNGARNYGCRCDVCVAAIRAANKTPSHKDAQWRSQARAVLAGCPPEKHGTLSGYQYHGCRCDLCRAAMSDRWRQRKR
jgi:hypothetical protein